MTKEEFINEYKDNFNIDRLSKVYDSYDLNNVTMCNDILFLMPILSKINFLLNEYKDILLNDYNSGNLKIMSDVSSQHKVILTMLNKGLDASDIINLIIEDYKSSIHILFSDDDEYYKTAYKDYCEHFNIKYDGENKLAKISYLFDDLYELLIK